MKYVNQELIVHIYNPRRQRIGGFQSNARTGKRVHDTPLQPIAGCGDACFSSQI
jgi:hypothetical protein